MSTVTVKNPSGQVVTFNLDPADPRSPARQDILESRINRGRLAKASKGDKSETRGAVVVTDADTGVTDEKGDYLKSVHGGGIDPDANGDALGRPSGSGATDADSNVAEKYRERIETVETKVESVKSSKK